MCVCVCARARVCVCVCGGGGGEYMYVGVSVKGYDENSDNIRYLCLRYVNHFNVCNTVYFTAHFHKEYIIILFHNACGINLASTLLRNLRL